jgi:hypothetical protein
VCRFNNGKVFVPVDGSALLEKGVGHDRDARGLVAGKPRRAGG